MLAEYGSREPLPHPENYGAQEASRSAPPRPIMLSGAFQGSCPVGYASEWTRFLADGLGMTG